MAMRPTVPDVSTAKAAMTALPPMARPAVRPYGSSHDSLARAALRSRRQPAQTMSTGKANTSNCSAGTGVVWGNRASGGNEGNAPPVTANGDTATGPTLTPAPIA